MEEFNGFVRNDNYIRVYGWMKNKLSLSGPELIIYACIYSYSQNGINEFGGKIDYLAEWAEISKSDTIKCLKTLLDKKFILKRSLILKQGLINFYRVNLKIFDYEEN